MSNLLSILEPQRGDPGALVPFAGERRDAIVEALAGHGAVLLRGFEGSGSAALEQVASTLGPPLMVYEDRAAHRTRVGGHVYTSADYPPSHELFFHNEATYARRFPGKLFLHCITAAETGGTTPLVDSTAVFDRLAPDIVRGFAEKGVSYVRNFGGGTFGPSWQTAFQVEDREQLEEYCRASEIETEWLDEARLRTRQTRPALIRHPESRRPVWFNHAAVLHVSTLPPSTRRTVLKLFGEADYPCNTYYGDGSSIEPEVLDAIRDAYRSEAVTFEWRAGDLLILDNLRVAHGRAPFKGPRKVLAALSEPTDWTMVEVLGVDQLGPL